MKRLFLFVLCLAVFAALASAETWNGTLVDVMCKDKPDLASHTRDCAIKCAKSGYGLMTEGGKFVKFDKAGSGKALAALKSSKKDKDLKATVTGTMAGDVIKVQSIKLD